MNIEFSQIPARLNYPKNLKGTLSSLHSEIITYITANYDGSHDMRIRSVNLLNTITRYVVAGDSLPSSWNASEPFQNIHVDSDIELRDVLGSLYINPKSINWDISPIASAPQATSKLLQTKPAMFKKPSSSVKLQQETDKSDLYIQPPTVPQFDVNKPWVSAVVEGTQYCIYASIPEVPTKQNEISATTDVDALSDSQLIHLFPLNFIRTRSPSMYDPVPGIPYHPQLGLMLPIDGFTDKEILDNIIKYPHLFKLSKVHKGEAISFYNTVEIDGSLERVSDVWKYLPDTSKIPYTADFVKEYVVRRYLLERDYREVYHKNPMYGTLDPYLTLFSTAADYISWGHSDVIDIARQCVKSRVSYKRSRNPILRRLENV